MSHAVLAGHVVQHLRNVDRGGDRLVVLIQTFLRRPVVVRRHQQTRIRTHRRRRARQLDCFGRRVRAGSGDHRNLFADAHDGAFHHLDVLFDAERRAIRRSCRPARCRACRIRCASRSADRARPNRLRPSGASASRERQCCPQAWESREKSGLRILTGFSSITSPSCAADTRSDRPPASIPAARFRSAARTLRNRAPTQDRSR